MAAGTKHTWKRALLHATVPFDDLDTHTVVQNLWLADLLGCRGASTCLWAGRSRMSAHVESLFPGFRKARFAVLHLYPKLPTRCGTRYSWRELAAWLIDRASLSF